MSEFKVGQIVKNQTDENVYFVRYLSDSEMEHVLTRVNDGDFLDCVINNDGVYGMFDSSNIRSI
jgi:hypothetical protein